ncbi:hypothetical protein [Nocardia sp. NPDC059228]|uniref:hypothetical protein n=1 Tax=Nocardia sp. NPDC059228 TaxID=3346777 RepID=UPI0036B85975
MPARASTSGNDPGGDSRSRLLDRAVTMWADGVGPPPARGLNERLFDLAATAPEVPAFAGPAGAGSHARGVRALTHAAGLRC